MIEITMHCPTCGKLITRKAKNTSKRVFCTPECYHAYRDPQKKKHVKLGAAAKPKRTDGVKVIITKVLPIYADFRPIPGKTYIAEKYECHRAPTGYVVSVNGHRPILGACANAGLPPDGAYLPAGRKALPVRLAESEGWQHPAGAG